MNELNNKVKQSWNTNPYTYGLSQTESYRDVGDIPDDALDARFFDEYIRKTRKHFHDAQLPAEPVAARFIDYEWLKGKKVLDIACGFGWATVEMARLGAHVTAIDLTPRAIAVTKRHLAVRGLTGDVREMDAQQMEFPDATFDFVHAWGCLMHMPNTEQAIGEIFRVLKPGGRSSGYMYNKNSVSYWWHFWFLRGVLQGKLLTYRGDTTRLVSRYTDGVTIGGNMLTKVYTPREGNALFTQAGFGNVAFQPWGPPDMLKSFPVSKVPLGGLLSYDTRKKIADRWGWGMIYRAEKPL
jgi:2-polyprenyl-3-methyl-5-hydroxy-6-metoxy-1,4-benzoquinol methylase